MNFKRDQVLLIEPQSELRFRGPFNVQSTSYIKLTNPIDKKVLFKIKTTAPKKYCVRPNSGVLDPKGHLEIAICLQPFIFDPAEKNKHKFMVQTVIAPDDPNLNFEQQWKEISPDNLMDTKLKCVFELPAEQNDAAPQEEPASKTNQKLIQPVTAPSPTAPIDSELQKAAAEVQHLREEESFLRQQHLMLKEEVMKYKQQLLVAPPNKYTPPVQQPKISVELIAIAIGFCIAGLIVGKFLL